MKYRKYTTDYKKKELAYFETGFKKENIKYRDGCKIITYIKKEKDI